MKSTPAKAAKKLAKVAPKAAKSTAKNVPAKAAAKKTKAPQTDSDKVFQIIKRHKKGVGVAKLRDKTGFNDKKISNIIHRAFKGGVIKRVGRGLYMAV